MTPRFHPLTVREVRRETADAVSIAFDVPAELADAYRFQQGQYLTLEAEIGGETVRRSYSICSGLDDGELRVAVKRIDGGRFSGFANENLKAGDRIDVMTPMGRFTTPLEPEAARVFLGVAAGSGITPILSIARTVLAREPESRFVLLYGNRGVGSILFQEALDDLKDRFLDRFTLVHVLSREAGDVTLSSGRIDAAKIETAVRHLAPGGRVDHAFLCGPGGLVEAGRGALAALGLPADRIHVELFTPAEGVPPAPVHVGSAADAAAGAGAAAEARIRLSGRSVSVPVAAGETIVDAARRAGLEVPYSCKGGMCCTCRAKITEGGVDMAVNWSLEPWEIAAGYVLTCQSRPATAVVAVDYDAV